MTTGVSIVVHQLDLDLTLTPAPRARPLDPSLLVTSFRSHQQTNPSRHPAPHQPSARATRSHRQRRGLPSRKSVARSSRCWASSSPLMRESRRDLNLAANPQVGTSVTKSVVILRPTHKQGVRTCVPAPRDPGGAGGLRRRRGSGTRPGQARSAWGRREGRPWLAMPARSRRSRSRPLGGGGGGRCG